MSRSLPSKPAAGLALTGVLSMVGSLTASALSPDRTGVKVSHRTYLMVSRLSYRGLSI